MLKRFLLPLLFLSFTCLAWCEEAVPAKDFHWPTAAVPIKLNNALLECEWRDGRPYCQRPDLVRWLGISPDGESSVDLIDALTDKGWMIQLDRYGQIQAVRPKEVPSGSTGAPPGGGGGGGAISRASLNDLAQLMVIRHPADSRQCGTGSKDFHEVPGGAFLTGLSVTLGPFMSIQIVHSVQPIFQGREGQILGKRHGDKKSGDKVYLLEAKDGYAIGGMTVRAGLLVNGFQVNYMRVEGGHLDPRDSYTSEWVGDRTGGSESTLVGDGAPVVGIFGKEKDPKDKDQAVCGIGLVSLPIPKVEPPKKKK